MNTITTIIIALLAILILWLVATYNRFVRLTHRAKEAWADIETQLKRRYDLIPNLVETVKGYATHEKEAFDRVTQARAQALSAHGPQESGKAENMLTNALRSVFAVAEAYPDLKANQNFLELQRELSDTENKIQASRRFYNSNARDLAIGIESFPGNIVAKIFSVEKQPYFELEEEAAKNPVPVSFS